jgi:hypothetical protein
MGSRNLHQFRTLTVAAARQGRLALLRAGGGGM